MLFVLLLLGALLAIAFKLNKAYPKQGFKWMIFFRKNISALIANLIVGIIIILSRDDLSLIYPVTKLSIAIIGFGGMSLWQGIVDTVTKDKNTVI